MKLKLNKMNETYQDQEDLAAIEEELQSEYSRAFEIIEKINKLAYDTPNNMLFGELVRKQLKLVEL